MKTIEELRESYNSQLQQLQTQFSNLSQQLNQINVTIQQVEGAILALNDVEALSDKEETDKAVKEVKPKKKKK